LAIPEPRRNTHDNPAVEPGRAEDGYRPMRRAALNQPVAAARRSSERRSRHGDESGFSLIELIVVVAVVPIILGGISAALISLLSLQQSVNTRVGDSNDALVASTNFNRDVQSAVLMTTLPSTQSTAACGSTSATVTQILGLEWGANSVSSGGPAGGYDTVVSYMSTAVVNPNTNKTTYTLTRQLCTFGTSTTPSTITTLGHDIGTPTVTIYGAKNGSGNFADMTPNFATTWFSSLGVTRVQLAVSGNQTQSGFGYSLVGLPGLSKSQGSASTLSTPSSIGCGFPTPGSGTYSTQLCFADFSSYDWTKASTGTCAPTGQPTQTGQLFQLAIASTPYTLSYCLQVSTNDVQPSIIPTYYNPSGDNSEAFLGNNGFYTGIPGKPALYQNASTLVTAKFTDIQVLDAKGQAATGWTLVTGDAESTDTNEWMVFSNTTLPAINWSILPNNGASDLYGNACYDDQDPNNTGLLAWTGSVPPTKAGVGSPSNGPPATSSPLTINTSTYATGATSILCESNQQLNKTGTLMLQAQEPTGSSAAQSVSITMQGAGLEALFLGVLL
jgi:prepilin-type N-terminal cleavage/methylation domain-containing protein